MATSSKRFSNSARPPQGRKGNQALRELSIGELVFLLGASERDLREIGERPEDHYRSFSKTRNGKTRTFTPPKQRLCWLHGQLLATVFPTYEPHPAAFAASGGGTVRAAQQHLKQKWILHLDLKDFFPSVARWKVERSLLELDMRADVIAILSGLVTLNNELPQGAPTSPLFANIVLDSLDARISGLAEKHGFHYTRYLDDLHLSGDRRIPRLAEREVRRFAEDENWAVHPTKGGVFGPTERQEILGLSVNQAMGLPNRKVRKVWRRIRTLAA